MAGTEALPVVLQSIRAKTVAQLTAWRNGHKLVCLHLLILRLNSGGTNADLLFLVDALV